MPAPRISPAAQQDIDDLYVFGIQSFGMKQADAYLAGLRESILTIAEHPMIGRERHDVRPPIRLISYEAHHLFYDLIDGTGAAARVASFG